VSVERGVLTTQVGLRPAASRQYAARLVAECYDTVEDLEGLPLEQLRRQFGFEGGEAGCCCLPYL
jgi:hypothetical protein